MISAWVPYLHFEKGDKIICNEEEPLIVLLQTRRYGHGSIVTCLNEKGEVVQRNFYDHNLRPRLFFWEHWRAFKELKRLFKENPDRLKPKPLI